MANYNGKLVCGSVTFKLAVVRPTDVEFDQITVSGPDPTTGNYILLVDYKTNPNQTDIGPDIIDSGISINNAPITSDVEFYLDSKVKLKITIIGVCP